MLTARGEESERVRGLSTGADDYIVKPFSVPELIARVRALLRRASPERVADVLAFGDIELDREKKRVSRGGRAIDLGPTEYRLLEFLMERPGRVFSREQLLDGVWGTRRLYRRAHRRRACRPAAQGAQPRPRRRSDPHRARRGLCARRPVRQGRLIGIRAAVRVTTEAARQRADLAAAERRPVAVAPRRSPADRRRASDRCSRAGRSATGRRRRRSPRCRDRRSASGRCPR